jgi:amidase
MMLAMSAIEMAAAIGAGEISSEELVRAHLEQIDVLQESVNAFVTVDHDGAIDAARRADRTPVEDRSGRPLFGVPCSIKDSLAVAGLTMTFGNVGMADFVPRRDDVLVERMRDAGAIVLGKTNMADLAAAYETDNHVAGRTNNPYDLARTPGGSSGGEAAAIASGCSPIGVGSDGWGSIRQPAHCVGIAALKPTPGRLPVGVTPILSLLGVNGPMARTVDDVSLGFSVLVGSHWSCPASVPVPVTDPSSVRVEGLRVAAVAQIGPLEADLATLDALRRAVAAFEAIGIDVEWIDSVPGDDRIHEFAVAGFDPTGGAVTAAQLSMMRGSVDELHPLTRLTIDMVAEHEWSLEDYIRTVTELMALRVQVRGFFERHDVLLSPVAADPAARHGQAWQRYRGVDYSRWHNVVGIPAATVRAGTSPDGLPINVQAASRPFDEHACLAAARHIERHTGGWTPPPLLQQT